MVDLRKIQKGASNAAFKISYANLPSAFARRRALAFVLPPRTFIISYDTVVQKSSSVLARQVSMTDYRSQENSERSFKCRLQDQRRYANTSRGFNRQNRKRLLRPTRQSRPTHRR
jgi:hypothetical protein